MVNKKYPGTSLMFVINLDFPRNSFLSWQKGMGNWQVVQKVLGFSGYG